MAPYALHGHLNVHPCLTSENTWPMTAVYLQSQTSRTALVVSRISWETKPSTATAKVNSPGRAMSCQLPLVVDDWRLASTLSHGLLY